MTENEKTVASAKEGIRRAIRRRRAALTADWIDMGSAQIADRVVALAEFSAAQVVCLYLSTASEVQTELILGECWETEKRVCVPVRLEGRRHYSLGWYAKGSRLEEGAFGIQEPVDVSEASIGDVDLMLVPGLAFDRSGDRVGHGGGHYDWLLRGAAPGRPTMTVGLAFEFQVLDQVPMGPGDIRLDAVVTEAGVYRAERPGRPHGRVG